MQIIKIISLALMALLFLSACSSDEKKVESNVDSFKVGEKIELSSVMGSKVTLKRVEKGFVIDGDENKILILDIFGTFCQPCKNEASNLMDFQLKNAESTMIVAMSHFENVTDEYIVENFSSKFNAYYFISNMPVNKKIIETLLADIGYTERLAVPFKVVLKGGKYQVITDIYESKPENKYYIGEVPIHVIQADIDRIKGN